MSICEKVGYEYSPIVILTSSSSINNRRALKKDGNDLNQLAQTGEFIYTYAYTPDEESLCHLEMRSFFGMDTHSNNLR